MAAATDELVLLERVFLCLGSADTDEKLQSSICKFLPPVLLKLSSPQEGVRKKVMSLLIHINKRVKSRPKVQLPVEALLLQYQDPSASTFVINFTIIYIKIGYPRMDIKKQVELVPSVLNAIDGKPLSHQDSLLLIIMPILGHIEIPMDPEKRQNLLGLKEKRNIAALMATFMVDMLILPYGSVGTSDNNNQQGQKTIDWSQFPVPPGLCEYAFKRVVGDTPPIPEQLEQCKLGIVKFITRSSFTEIDMLTPLIIASADTRFSVANLADMELRKIVSTLDWSAPQLVLPLYILFLGSCSFTSTQKDIKPEMKRLPANTRIRLKLLQYLCRVKKNAIILPAAIQIIFDSLYGNNTNKKLKTLALDFALNMVQQCSLTPLTSVAPIILNGMIKLIAEGEQEHKSMAYTIIGQLGKRIPTLVNKDMSLVEKFFEALTTTNDNELRRTIRDALVSMSSSFIMNNDNEQNITLMNSLLSSHIESTEPSVRYVAVHYVATVFPQNHGPSRYLLLIACGDEKPEVSTEAIKALYGTSHKNERHTKDHYLPDFSNLVTYINWQLQTRLKNKNQIVQIGNNTLPYNLTTYNEIITYLRLCLAKSADIKLQDGPDDNHPNDNSPIMARYLNQLLVKDTKYIDAYLNILEPLNRTSADKISLNALLEIIGTIPVTMTSRFVSELTWLRTLLTSTKTHVREIAAKIHAIIITHNLNQEEFDKQADEFINTTMKNKLIETQHGALVALPYMIESKIMSNKLLNDSKLLSLNNWNIYCKTIDLIYLYLKNPTGILVEAATQAIGIIGKTYSLPIPDDDDDDGDEKVLSKKKIVDTLFSILTNAKISHKIKENAIMSLGLICIGEEFPWTKLIIEKFINLSKETKDSSIHFTIADALVLCVQGKSAPEARNAWIELPIEYENRTVFSSKSDELLEFLLNELLKLAPDPHPNSRQSICIWLLAIVKRNSKRKAVIDKLSEIQNAFMSFLSENNEIVQDVGSKGICLVYDTSEESGRNELVSNLLNQLSDGRRAVTQVNPDTKLFEDGALGKAPTGGNISTYKEICSLASDLNKPDLIYRFLQLANHNAVWTSKKGAAYGFSAIASVAKNELDKYLPNIVPKLYRYQFDPTPKIQQSMSSIWHAIVPSTQKALEQYHDEILDDLIINLTNNQWRVRISCCLALSDLLKSNAPINYEKRSPDLWKQLFRVMDDVHEDTRNTATKTAMLFSKICIRQCDIAYGKTNVLEAILPVFLDIGITHNVTTVRSLSLQTVSQFVTTAGPMLKSSLVNLIPALLTATDLENTTLNLLSTRYSGLSDDYQTTIDNVRTNVAKSHNATETMKKCTQYIDSTILKELMPKVIELIKSSIGLGSKVAISHFLIYLCIQLKNELQPYTGKIITALLNGLMDRNAAVRKTNAITIGHIVGSAKDTHLDKLFNTLNKWYMEREDDSIRYAIGQTLQSISNQNYEIIKNYNDIVLPLTFFAMHCVKTVDNENTITLWTDLWNEIAHGTETAIKKYLTTITNTLNQALESASWTTKAQAANAVSTVAIKIGTSMDDTSRYTLLKILSSGLQGRTWNGKELLLNALSTLACNSKEPLSKDQQLTKIVTDALYKECKKDNLEYRRHALKAFTDVLHELEIDNFVQLYDIAQEILIKLSKKNNGDDDDNDEDESSAGTTEESNKKRENQMKLQEVVYESLGKAWPSNPESKTTQDKYCLQFVTHCYETLPNSTRTIQVAIMTTLNRFVEKLLLFKMTNDQLTIDDHKKMNKICQTIHDILKISIGISKYTRIRKESLNIFLTMSKKFIDNKHDKQFDNLKSLFCQILPELTLDNQPEVRTRIVDIKSIFEI
ncbi:hypothetical protein HCN44_003248 [Aphidius gifuensis]|uniref:Proteasome-associated protein ECM29-like protein n=1 Tax=Aphidius gifuensis TaxID=684658 RepID=A0A834XK63_APHGI|nr:proteasome adapter and scaffold protein ECM29 [Aphidius gifuensis]KAF7987486.1 hypothetical protein HCN44_003248 [Aphidius gifuensis]